MDHELTDCAVQAPKCLTLAADGPNLLLSGVHDARRVFTVATPSLAMSPLGQKAEMTAGKKAAREGAGDEWVTAMARTAP
ncbi:hypothetical protein EVG20_g3630 [Dentipellis fragilis]|uniref:Uncharacterized protein n=1 Tax=Dentipellis fragilis TaxID=205917 RepID=A0A4Y9Z4L5_9AGAM|nr:hypothetical protein EVG20_g3630 [Dentipellis fragilis]